MAFNSKIIKGFYETGEAANDGKGPGPCEHCTQFKEDQKILCEKRQNITMADETSQVADFYKDKSVFITGGSGFLGKVLIEKLLRCTEIRSVYILLRSKKGLTPKERLEKMMSERVFSRLREEKPGSESKVVIVNGDICLPELGISQYDVELMARDVSVVFHSAATIKLHEPLRVAAEMNVIGTQKILTLCKKLPHLESMVHVSTSYTNCNLEEYPEVVIPSKIPYNMVLDLLNNVDDDEYIAKLTPELLEGRPNTYGYTKALAEQLIMKESDGLHIGIARPPVVSAAMEEPFPGWCVGATGPNGLLSLLSVGIIRSIKLNDTAIVDFVPVDYVINHIMTVGWITAKTKPDKPKVYTLASGCLNPVSMREALDIAIRTVFKYPSKRLYRYPRVITTQNNLLHKFIVYFDQYIPAKATDLYLQLRGKKPRVARLYDKVEKEVEAVAFFYMHDFKFHCNNTISLLNEMSPKDKEMFDFDVSHINWPQYVEMMMLGIRKFLLTEEMVTIPDGQKALRISHFTQRGIELFGLAALTKLAYLSWTYIGLWDPFGL